MEHSKKLCNFAAVLTKSLHKLKNTIIINNGGKEDIPKTLDASRRVEVKSKDTGRVRSGLHSLQ